MGSTTNSLVLEPATIEDVPAITEIWFASFTQPLIRQIFPNTPGMHQWHRDWHMADIQKSHYRYLRVVDTEAKDKQGRPRLVAFGKWDLAMPDERGRRFPIWHADSPYQLCEEFIAELEQARKRVMGDEKHYSYVDASKEGAPLYQKHGFVDFNAPGSEVAAMARRKAAPSDRT
ncbi:hypothetical protein PDIG_35700 [Penicillium digitatum PHI26]|uniref:N-acetyltransferase domain-containing protein n=1 Tax=Penicillium digitatum (strain PHI26 / CECT 20796) TaxID=1170229 RepID=K9FZB5_PEND2|nr:hypothetical protein PDIG_35700 [Penicillium digitatum PHI26]